MNAPRAGSMYLRLPRRMPSPASLCLRYRTAWPTFRRVLARALSLDESKGWQRTLSMRVRKDAFARPVRVGSADPAQRVAISQMSVRYADRHAVAAPGEVADCREAVAATRRGWTMDAPGQTLSVERAILSQAQPTSLLAQADSRALDAGRLHDPATRIMAAACVGEANSATATNPELGKADTRFGRFHSRGLCTYRVTV
jgi:hypothetical protein